MYNLFLVNDILKFNINDTLERILYIESDCSICYTIKLYIDKMIITKRKIEDLVNDKIEGNITILFEDRLSSLMPENFMSEKHNIIMDKAYEIVKFIAGIENEPYCFYGKNRHKLVTQAAQEFNVSEKVIYKYLRLYWQGGKIKFALYPKYSNCGGKGKLKKTSGEKLGRPDTTFYLTGEKKGICIDEDTKKIFDIALHRYKITPEKINLAESYRKMKSDFYTDKEYIEDRIVIKTMSIEKKPTFRQFQYYYYKNKDIENEINKTEGEKSFNLNYRALPSNSTLETFGPGFRYQVDATVADVYLVSRIDRGSIIGRPVVYLAVDVYSRLIAGLHVCLEGPNWNGISSLIYNCMEDKVNFCKRFGIDINKKIWPAEGIPHVLLGDRGELISPIGEKAIANLGITFENAPSGRGDAKGIVEKNFDIVNTKIKYWLPGAVKKEYRELRRKQLNDACLDIYQFTQIMIYTVLYRNKKIMDDYPVTQQILDDHVVTTPLDIWNWGMKNMSGALRRLPDELLRINLMRSGTATVTESGIKFNRALYTNPIEDYSKLYVKARKYGGWSVDVSYDNRDMTSICLLDKETNIFHKLNLKNTNLIYLNRTYEEMEDYHFMKKAESIGLSDNKDQNDNDYYSNIDEVKKVAEASRENKNISGMNNIREERKKENEDYSKKQALSASKCEIHENCEEEQTIAQASQVNTSIESTALDRLKNRKKCI